MVKVDTAQFEYELVEDLKAELSVDDPMFNETILLHKVRNVLRELQTKRCYKATTYDADEILEDMYSYYSVVRNVALYDYNQTGVEFQKTSNENYSRTYIDRDELWRSVQAFVGVIS